MKFIFLLLLSAFYAASYGQDTVDVKYQAVINFLKSDSASNNRIAKTFEYLPESESRPVKFNIGKEIWYLSLSYFQNELQKNNYGIDSMLIRYDALFKTKYEFNTFELPAVQQLVPANNSNIVLTFSKPFGNYLIAEMLWKSSNGWKRGRFPRGRFITFLFIFNNEGLVSNVLYCSGIYH